MTKFTEKENRNFWNKYARKLKDNPRGAHSDNHIVDLENEFIESVLRVKKPKRLLDIGCGNGTRTLKFSKYVKEKTVGIDYSDIMIKQANRTLAKQNKSIKGKISFEVQDAKSLHKYKKFDVITSCRCFVNQPSSKKQIELFKMIYNMLKKNGSLIIAEQSKEGLENINNIRKKFGLDKIRVPWHNLPIKESVVFTKINDLFKISKINRLGIFYYLSRVIHPALVYPSEPNPNAKINDLALKTEKTFQKELKEIVNSFEDLGAHLLVHFKKK